MATAGIDGTAAAQVEVPIPTLRLLCNLRRRGLAPRRLARAARGALQRGRARAAARHHALFGGCGLLPSGAYHQELPTTVADPRCDAPLALGLHPARGGADAC